MSWFWLSFAGDENGGKNLGCCMVQADNAVGAVRRAHQLKINPGGGVQIAPIPEGWEPQPRYMNRLIPREEAMLIAEMEREQFLQPESNL